MHDARARLAGWMNACDRPASQRAHGWLAGWRILTEDYICVHERPGSRARVLKVVCKSAESLGRMVSAPHLCQPFTYDFHSFLQILVLNLPTSHRCMGKRTIAAPRRELIQTLFVNLSEQKNISSFHAYARKNNMWILDLNQLSARSWESLICSRIDRVTIPSESLPLMWCDGVTCLQQLSIGVPIADLALSYGDLWA